MTELSGNDIIRLSRGDTVSFKFVINIGSKSELKMYKYKLRPSDALYFGVMEPRTFFEDAIIRKRYTNDDLNPDGSVTITVDAVDTLRLEPGVYYYEIKLKTPAGVKTLVTKKKFVIGE